MYEAPRFADGTADAQFEKMNKFFAQSDTETRLALKIEPKLSIAYAVLLGEHAERAIMRFTNRWKATRFESCRPVSWSARRWWNPDTPAGVETTKGWRTSLSSRRRSWRKTPSCIGCFGFIEADEGETQGIQGELDQSIATLTRAIQKGGDYSGFYFIRGESYVHSTSFEQGLEDFDLANELSPQDPELLILRADVLARLGRPKEVLADLQFAGSSKRQTTIQFSFTTGLLRRAGGSTRKAYGYKVWRRRRHLLWTILHFSRIAPIRVKENAVGLCFREGTLAAISAMMAW
jgi:hypothetical protein